jgi:hypothetical protein
MDLKLILDEMDSDFEKGFEKIINNLEAGGDGVTTRLVNGTRDKVHTSLSHKKKIKIDGTFYDIDTLQACELSELPR